MPNNIVQCRDLVSYYNSDSATESCSIPDVAMRVQGHDDTDDSATSSSANTKASVDASVSTVDASSGPDVKIPAESRHTGQVLMQANNAPTLRRTDTKDIIRFLRKYALYPQHIEDVNADSVVKVKPRSVKSMFDPVLLSALMKYERDFQAVGPTLCDSFLLKSMKRQQGSDKVTRRVSIHSQRL